MGNAQANALEYLSGGGRCADALRKVNWAETSVGAPDAWPPALQVFVRMLPATPHPMLVLWGPDLVCLCNDAAAMQLGVAGKPARLLYGDDDTYENVGQQARSAFERGENYTAKVQMVRKDGSPIWIHLQGSALKESRGEAIWMMTDVTSQHLYQEQVEHIAFHDPLTGLANRLLLADRVNQAIKSAAATGDVVAVAYMDLDGFKAVNDRLGHDAGDQLLKVIASRATACVRAGDTVARLGGDEFVIVLASLGDRLQCEHVLSRLLNEVARPVGIREAVEASVSGSIGVALYPTNGTQGTELLLAADAAMYGAKRGGKGAIVYASSAETVPPTAS